MIYASTLNDVIGTYSLKWMNVKHDLIFFKNVTASLIDTNQLINGNITTNTNNINKNIKNVCIIGNKTWKSLNGFKFSNRHLIIVNTVDCTNSWNDIVDIYNDEIHVKSFDDAMELALIISNNYHSQNIFNHIFFVGASSIFKYSYGIADYIINTKFKIDFDTNIPNDLVYFKVYDNKYVLSKTIDKNNWINYEIQNKLIKIENINDYNADNIDFEFFIYKKI